jgi:hypothetical protein
MKKESKNFIKFFIVTINYNGEIVCIIKHCRRHH